MLEVKNITPGFGNLRWLLETYPNTLFIPVCHEGNNRSQALFYLLKDMGLPTTSPHGAFAGRDMYDTTIEYWTSTPIDTTKSIFDDGRTRVLRWHEDDPTVAGRSIAILPPDIDPEDALTDLPTIIALRQKFTETLYNPTYLRESNSLPDDTQIIYLTFCRAGATVKNRLEEAGDDLSRVIIINIDMKDFCTDGLPDPHLRMYAVLKRVFFGDAPPSVFAAAGVGGPAPAPAPAPVPAPPPVPVPVPCPSCGHPSAFDGRCHTSRGGCGKTPPPDGKWVCPNCTLHNELSVTTCSVCGSATPTPR